MGIIKKILILSVASHIGDMIMTIPMLKLLHQKMPSAEITLVVLSEGTRQIFEACPYIKSVIKVEREKNLIRNNLNSLFSLRKYNFDLCITACVASASLYLGIVNIIAKCIGAKRWIGYSLPKSSLPPFGKGGIQGRYSPPPFLSFSFLQDDTVTIELEKHYVFNNINLLSPLGIYPEEGNFPELELWFREDDMEAAERFITENEIGGNRVVGIHPGSNQWMMKRWPKEKFAALIDKIQSEYPKTKVLLFGGAEEEELKLKIAKNTRHMPIIVSKMSLRKTAALIKRCNLFIGNDSALMHIAAAVKTPVVGIFGPTNPIATAPYTDKSVVVTNQMDCQPCCDKARFVPILKFICKQNPPYACLTQLPVAKVFEVVKRLMSKE